ncbi:MAG: NADH-quinone oxidoreductase subunit NuoH [Armatimonadota bacterium]|nr:NADH-quinone oxidoreductase subunit NuoH [Armatimonadota bacterium]
MDSSVLITIAKMAGVAAAILTFVLIVVMYPMIYGLRRVMAFMQSRIGPNRVGPQGLLQTPADALKLLHKEDIIPRGADKWIFTIAPILVFVPAYLVYVVIPFGDGMAASNLNIGIVYISAVTSIAIIGIVMAGWASNNKWSLLGAFRAAAQLVSYEVPLVLAFCVPVVLAGTLSLSEVVNSQAGDIRHWFIFRAWGLGALAFVVYLVAGLAEANLTPFDIMEAESELVAGFNVEYSGMKFALFFLAEFAAAFTLSALAITLFFGGWQAPFSLLAYPVFGITVPETIRVFGQAIPLEVWTDHAVDFAWFFGKSLVMVFVLIWIRATLPRVRVDQLMNLAWKFLIPVGLVTLVLTGFYVALS